VHSNHYRSGLKYQNKDVLVVGCGNYGMEIAYDLSIFEAKPCIVVRSPVRFLSA
jgi:indole-3-pyruvate monooxygenase